MWISTLFHKIKIFCARRRGRSLPPISSEKLYGDAGEEEVTAELREALPDCRMKRNVIVDASGQTAEIDCLIFYRNKLFAIEIKHWKGRLIEADGRLFKAKTDRYTGETHLEELRSPFGQLARSIRLLKEEEQSSAWINGIVYIDGEEFEGFDGECAAPCFCDPEDCARYIEEEGRTTDPVRAQRLFDACLSPDILYSEREERYLRGIIADAFLHFSCDGAEISRADIESIEVKHRLLCDELTIKLKTGGVCTARLENAKILVYDGDLEETVALCKVDLICLGGEE